MYWRDAKSGRLETRFWIGQSKFKLLIKCPNPKKRSMYYCSTIRPKKNPKEKNATERVNGRTKVAHESEMESNYNVSLQLYKNNSGSNSEWREMEVRYNHSMIVKQHHKRRTRSAVGPRKKERLRKESINVHSVWNVWVIWWRLMQRDATCWVVNSRRAQRRSTTH